MNLKGKLPYREIRISLPIYKAGVIIMITRDTERAAANVRKWYDGEFDQWDADSALGKTLSREGYTGSVIWLRDPPKTSEQIAVLCHEALHATARLMDRLRIPLTYSNEEAYAYVMEYIVSEVLREVRKPSRRKKSA
jgi:hypothetical protein